MARVLSPLLLDDAYESFFSLKVNKLAALLKG